MPAPANLIGQKFNSLLVLREAKPEEKRVKGCKEWFCQCDCGNTTVIRTNYLKSGHTKTCGCGRAEFCKENFSKDLTGQKFGKLTAIKRLNKKYQDGSYYWLCKCECGNEKEAVSNHLLRGDISSCGCIGASKGEWLIKSILDEHNVNYKTEYTFKDLKDINKLRFDFAIFDKDNNLECLIEF